jgi:hypothetical protein
MDRETGDSGNRAQNEERPYKNTTQKLKLCAIMTYQNTRDEPRCSQMVCSF